MKVRTNLITRALLLVSLLLAFAVPSTVMAAGSATLLASAARTADYSTGTIGHYAPGSSAFLIIVDVTADPSTASVTPRIEVQDPVSGDYVAIWTAAAAIAATGKFMYQIQINNYSTAFSAAPLTVAEAGSVTEAVMLFVPPSARLTFDHAASESLTSSVGIIWMQ
jgi:hypothetical protein